MKTVYIIRAFDAKRLEVFTPAVGVFTSKRKAQEVADKYREDHPESILAGIEETLLNEED